MKRILLFLSSFLLVFVILYNILPIYHSYSEFVEEISSDIPSTTCKYSLFILLSSDDCSSCVNRELDFIGEIDKKFNDSIHINIISNNKIRRKRFKLNNQYKYFEIVEKYNINTPLRILVNNITGQILDISIPVNSMEEELGYINFLNKLSL